MKLVRFGPPGMERPGILDGDGQIRDLSGHVSDLSGETLTDEGLGKLRALNITSLPAIDRPVRLGPCVPRPCNFIGIGKNYAKHAAETGSEPPKEPLLFNKSPGSTAGPNDVLILPPQAKKADWEAELAVVIGVPARFVSEAEAFLHIAGYCTCTDVSVRAHQLESTGQYVKGKSHDGFGPIGPWLVTRDDVPDPQSLHVFMDLNGIRMQDGNTHDMIFGVPQLISYISRFMTLQTGDIITTGTPDGVGLGQNPQRFLRDGDHVEIGVEKLGTQSYDVAQPSA